MYSGTVKIIYISSGTWCVLGWPPLQYTKVIQKVKNVCAYSPLTCFVAADHWFLVSSVMSKSCLMQFYVVPYHIVIAEIAVAMVCLLRIPPTVRCEILFFFCRPMRSYVILPKGKLSRGILLHDNGRVNFGNFVIFVNS